MDTITARLDLVDTFLHNEDLFYATLQQLQNLASLDSMLINIVVVPSRKQQQQLQQRRQGQENGRGLGISSTSTTQNNNISCNRSSVVSAPAATPTTGKTNAANARIASKGISALVCIKSTLASIPVLASILRNHLDRIESETNSNGDKNNASGNEDDEQQEAREEASIATAKTSLLVGLGLGKGHGSSSSTGSFSSSDSSKKDHQLLRAIIFALSQPELRVVRDAIDEAFTESTSYTRNANAMKHQECFALKSSDDNGMMDVLRKVRRQKFGRCITFCSQALCFDTVY